MEVVTAAQQQAALVTPNSPKSDINFNSPSHRSSQDGSFIQDDAESMQLILDVNRGGSEQYLDAATMLLARQTNNQPPQHPNGCLTASWVQRARDYDANIAELDFGGDDIVSRDIMSLAPAHRDTKMYMSIGQDCVLDANAILNNNNNNNNVNLSNNNTLDKRLYERTALLPMGTCEHLLLDNRSSHNQQAAVVQPPINGLAQPQHVENSMELSSGESLFSSAHVDDDKFMEEIMAANPTFISTDSLDMSEMVSSSHIRNACAAKPRDYCLTFSRMSDSTSAVPPAKQLLLSPVDQHSQKVYTDAPLSDAADYLSLSAHAASSTSYLSISQHNQQQRQQERSGMSEGTQQQLTTWGTIKRSYEVRTNGCRAVEDAVASAGEHSGTPKSSSLPCISGHRGAGLAGGAAEQLSSAHHHIDRAVPIYDLSTSITAGKDKRPRSLYELFRERLRTQELQQLDDGLDEQHPRLFNDDGDLLEETDEHCSQAEEHETHSSGYMTGEQHPSGGSGVVDNQRPDYQPQVVPVDDYNYAEYYMGDGRYIDLNHNEIGYTPPSTAGVQHSPDQQQQQQPDIEDDDEDEDIDPEEVVLEEMKSDEEVLLSSRDRWHKLQDVPDKPPRTFANLLQGKQQQPVVTERLQLKTSATQLPVHVVHQAVQTSPTHAKLPPPMLIASSQSTADLFGHSALAEPAAPPLLHQQHHHSKSTNDVTKPNLDFMRMAHEIPVFMPSVPPFPVEFLTDEGGEPAASAETTGRRAKERSPVDQQQPPRRSKSTQERLASLLSPAAQLEPQLNALIQQCQAASHALYAANMPSTSGLPPTAAGTSGLQFNAATVGLLPQPPAELYALAAAQPKPSTSRSGPPPLLDLSGLPNAPNWIPNKDDCSSTDETDARATAADDSPGGTTARGVPRDRDSGLGSSGPSHIHDWDSLATLLPKDVAHACSYMRTNSNGAPATPALNIDKLPGGKRLRPQSEPRHQRRSWQRLQQGRAHSRYECIHEHEQTNVFCSASPTSAGCSRCHGHAASTPSAGAHYTPAVYTCCVQCAHAHQQQHHVNMHCCCQRLQQQHAKYASQRGGGGRRATADASNLRRWRHKFMQQSPHHDYYWPGYCQTEVTSDESDSDCTLGDAPLARRATDAACCRGSSLPPRPGPHHHNHNHQQQQRSHAPHIVARRMSVSTLTSDEDDFNGDRRVVLPTASQSASCYATATADTMCSEYQLRERETGIAQRQFYSLENMRSQLAALHGNGSGKRIGTPQQQQPIQPCATCYRVRSPTSETCPPVWAQPTELRQYFCDCQTSDVIDEAQTRRYRQPEPTTGTNVSAEERSVWSTAVYRQKREMIDVVVRICDQLVSAFSKYRFQQCESQPIDREGVIATLVRHSLCPAIERVLADGLLPGRQVWQVVKSAATLGPATKSVHALVTELSSTVAARNGDNADSEAHRFVEFVEGLLRLRSLDCWLSYLVLKDRLIEEHYAEAAFVRRAISAFRSLFDRMIMAIQPLSMLPFHRTNPLSRSLHVMCTKENDLKRHSALQFALVPSRLPADSRVPKSSSVPTRLFGSVDGSLGLARSQHNAPVVHSPLLLARAPPKSASATSAFPVDSNTNATSRQQQQHCKDATTPLKRPTSRSRIPRPTSLATSQSSNGSANGQYSPRTPSQQDVRAPADKVVRGGQAKRTLSSLQPPKRSVAVTKTVQLRSRLQAPSAHRAPVKRPAVVDAHNAHMGMEKSTSTPRVGVSSLLKKR